MISINRNILGPLPQLTLTNEEIRDVMESLFAKHPGSHDFMNFIRLFSAILIEKKIGFKAEQNTTYSGDISMGDQVKVREIIWDMIVERHLTVGGQAGHDQWPNFSVTERGKTYFASLNHTPL